MEYDIFYYVSKQCPPDWVLPEYVIHYYDFTFVMGGEATYYANKKPVYLKAGDCFCGAKGILRSAVTNPENPMKCIAFNVRDIEDLPPLPEKIYFGDNSKLEFYLKEFDIEWIQKNQDYKKKTNALFTLILCELIKSSENSDVNIHIANAKRYIAEHINKRISVEEVARHVGLNPVYFGSMFRKKTGMSVIDYINMAKINKSAMLLKLGDISVTEAAEQTGFCDLYYFSKTFKRIKGVCPSEYKRKKFGDIPASS